MDIIISQALFSEINLLQGDTVVPLKYHAICQGQQNHSYRKCWYHGTWPNWSIGSSISKNVYQYQLTYWLYCQQTQNHDIVPIFIGSSYTDLRKITTKYFHQYFKDFYVVSKILITGKSYKSALISILQKPFISSSLITYVCPENTSIKNIPAKSSKSCIVNFSSNFNPGWPKNYTYIFER